MKSLLASLIALFILAVACKSASADVKNIDKLRKFYYQHNLDFFGELIADEQNVLDDEKRHAKIELLADDARTRALTQLDALLGKARGPMEGELLLRKATLLSDRARTATYFQNNPFKASKLKTPNTYLRQSIEVSQIIERKFPHHPKMDVVLFTIAYNYGELKEHDNAFKYYQRLVSRFVESPLVGDARLAIAEIQFDKRHFTESLNQLREIVKVDHPRLKNFALYKMAWTYYNLADLDSAMNSLERVITGVNSAPALQRARLELRKEALHDLVAFYAERGGHAAAAGAAEYFERVGHTPDAIVAEYSQAREKRLAAFAAKNAPTPDEESAAYQLAEYQELLFRLVQVYRDQGQHENSMLVAEQLLKSLDHHPKAVALYRLRAESAEKLRRREKVVAELERLATVIEADLPAVDEYSSKGLPESTIGSLKETFETEAAPPLILGDAPKPMDSEKQLSAYQRQLAKLGFEAFNDFAGFLHGEWSKTQSGETARQALAVYDLGVRVFLSPWRGTPIEAGFELRRHRAQLSFALKRWEAAAQDFRWLSLHMTSPEATVVSNIQGEVGALESKLKESPVKISKGNLNELHQQLLTAYDTFLGFYILNAHMREPSANFVATSARLYKEYGQNDEALRRLKFYSRYFADQKDAVASTRDILALLAQGERWEELRDFSGRLIKGGAYKTSAIAKEIAHSREYASLRLLESLEKSRDWQKASKEFEQFAKENPESSYVSQALIKSANAALENSKTNNQDVESAIVRLEEATHAPDNAVRLQAWLGLEGFYRKSFQWKRLRTLYEEALKLSPDAKTLAALKTNLSSLKELDSGDFKKSGDQLIAPDSELAQLSAAQAKFETVAREFRALRFVKSNNNPARNFKRKADAHAEAAALADAVAEKAPKSLRGGAAVWANVVKAELLFEFADTLDGSTLPAVLAAATDADRKSYRETIASQTKELRATAQKYAVDSVKLVAQVDYPYSLDERLNALLERCGEHSRLSHASFAAHWAKRPGAAARSTNAGASSNEDAEIRKLGMRLLRAGDHDEARKIELRLSEAYLKSGESGYAYAITAAVRAENGKDEWAIQAAHQQFLLDLARLPQNITKAAQDDTLTAQQRWNLARWLAGRQTGLSDDEKSWLSEGLVNLLRPVVSATPILQANVEKH